jgi:hypothetical protein
MFRIDREYWISHVYVHGQIKEAKHSSFEAQNSLLALYFKSEKVAKESLYKLITYKQVSNITFLKLFCQAQLLPINAI